MAGSIVIVAGALGNKPGNGGEAWVVSSWVRGLRQLGFDVWLIEELSRIEPLLATSIEGDWFSSVTQRWGLQDRAILFSGEHVLGADDLASVRDLIAASVLVVNISGNLRRADVLQTAQRTAYIDLDPGFTQIWQAKGLIDLGLQHHDLHFTVGENIGTSACGLPTGDIRWLPVRQPVILSDWPPSPVPENAALTTVATWRCPFGSVEWNGTSYGLKLHEFRKIIDLPHHVSAPMELALTIHDGDVLDRRGLLDHGWRLRNANEAAESPDAFRSYVQQSLGEFTVAQGVYVHGRTGWFSDRTARYLASGRPAIVHDTGLGNTLPFGEGLMVFSNLGGAIDAVESVMADPARHGKAARLIAEEHFDATRLLADFADRCDVSP